MYYAYCFSPIPPKTFLSSTLKFYAVNSDITTLSEIFENVILIILVPSRPQYFVASEVQPNNIKLAWQPPEVMGQLDNYTLYYKNELGDTGVVAVNPMATNYTAGDLTEGTNYKFALTAFSDNGESDGATINNVQTTAYGRGYSFLGHLVSSLAVVKRHIQR